MQIDKTKMAINVFDTYAQEYQNKFMDMDLYNDSLDLFCQSILTPHAEILDIACGPGNITRYLLKKRPDFNILGIDLSLNMLKLAKINNPSAEFQLLDCRDIGQLTQQFEAIICGFGLPYLSNEETEKLIRDASALLKSKGVIYISTMEDDYYKSGIKTSSSGSQLFMYYHEAETLTRILKKHGFKIIDLQRKEYPAGDGTNTTDLLILAGK